MGKQRPAGITRACTNQYAALKVPAAIPFRKGKFLGWLDTQVLRAWWR